jgi:hypothetical protein
MNNSHNLWVVDIEVFKNFHSLVGINVHTNKQVSFVIHPDWDDRIKYISWLQSGVEWITFNGLNYDYPVVHQILRNKNFFLSQDISKVVKFIYKKSCEIIERDYNVIRDEDSYIHQYDLFRIHHFNNVARATSLKKVEFYLNWHNLQDLPKDPHSEITKEEIPEILEYNLNDVLATKAFWDYTVDQGKIKLRQDLSKKYGLNFRNKDDVSMGSDIVLHLYSEKTGLPKSKIRNLKTYRSLINLDEAIFPYVKFKTEPFKVIEKFFRRQKVADTNSVFRKIKPDKDLLKYCSRKSKYFDNKNNLVKYLNVEIQGVPIVYGSGGIHAAKKGEWLEDNDWIIMSSDVASLYPNLKVNNGVYPEHLGPEYLYVYDIQILRERIAAKHRLYTPDERPDDQTISDGLKLSLNGDELNMRLQAA